MDSGTNIDFRQAKLSVITPVYNNAETLEELYRQIRQVAEAHFADFELIYVVDGCKDHSERVVLDLCKEDERVRLATHARNFGQHTAFLTGLSFASGDYVMLIDADLEEDPSDLPALMKKLEEGYEIAVGVRPDGARTFGKRITAKLYSLVFDYLSDHKIIDNATTLRLMTKRYVSFLLLFRERPFLAGFTAWIGLPVGLVPVKWSDRERHSSYNLRRLLSHARVGLIGFSSKLMRIALVLGLVVSCLSLFFAAFYLVSFFVYGNVPPGYTSTVVLVSFLFGIQFLLMGIFGEYLQEIFHQVKGRPRQLLLRTCNLGSTPHVWNSGLHGITDSGSIRKAM